MQIRANKWVTSFVPLTVINNIRYCINICIFLTAVLFTFEAEVYAKTGKNLNDSAPPGSQNEVASIVNSFFEALLSKTLDQYLSLLDKDKFQYISQLVSTDSSNVVYNYHAEKEAVENTLARVELELKRSKFVLKNELSCEVPFELDETELYDKTLRFKQSIYHINGVFVFRFARDKKNVLKIREITEIIKREKQAAVSFGFVKYIHSELYSEEMDKKKKKTIVHGEEFDEINYTTKYIDNKTQKTVWFLKHKQLWRFNLPEHSDIYFGDAAGKKIVNIESIE